MLSIRSAEPGEAERLTGLASRSEAYWGYDSGYMDNFEIIYKVTEDFIRNTPTFVVTENDVIIGFYSVSIGEKENRIEYFYVEPKSIGHGYGEIMWRHMADCFRRKGLRGVTLVTSPQAKGFYEKMGAKQITEVESLLVRGRKIPKLEYIF